MNQQEKVDAWLQENPLEDEIEFPENGVVKLYTEDDSQRPMIWQGEDAYKIVQSEDSVRSFIELFDDVSLLTLETYKIDLRPDVLLLLSDSFAYVEEC